MSGPLSIREARQPDLASTIEILRRGELSTRQPAALAFYRDAPNSRSLVGEVDGSVVAVGLAILFGRSGWVGNVAVLPERRRRGFGTAMTEAATAWLQAGGARTVLLTATAEGSPIYGRIGFVDDGEVYGIWTRTRRASDDRVERPATRAAPEDQVLGLDREATGEEREPYLGPFVGHAVAPAGDGPIDAYRIPLPWGGGPIVARTPKAGRTLLCDLVAVEPTARIGFCDSNIGAVTDARDLGFERVAEDLRMRLGPPVERFRPEMIYGVFSFCCG